MVGMAFMAFACMGYTGFSASLSDVGDPTAALAQNQYERDLQIMLEDGRYASAFNKVLDKLSIQYSDSECARLLQMMQGVYESLLVKNKHKTMPRFDDSCDEETYRISLVKDDEALRTLEIYDALKDAAMKLDTLLEREVQRNYSDDIRAKCKTLQAMKRSVKQGRTRYLSWEVVAPYIANTKCLVEKATAWYNDDEDALMEAGMFLAKGVHKEWLMQSDVDVRIEFGVVYQSIKEELSAAEMEYLKVLTTLTSSLDPSKPMGADLWWK